MRSTPSTPSLDQRARELPVPEPGVVLSIPIDLYPAYMRLHGLVPGGYKDPILYVKKEVTNDKPA